MKTGKFLLAFAAIAAVSMSSCSQDEELVTPDNQLSENAVVFGTYIGASRGTVMDLTALKGTGFGVMAYYTKSDNFGTPSEDNTQTPNFMYNQQVYWDKDATTPAWAYTPLKYWPNNSGDKVSFFAYAPYTGTFGDTNITSLSANNIAGDPTLTFVMDGDVSKQIDLLYADAKDESNKIVDLTKPGVGDLVKFNFKHALSRISFSRQLLIDNDDKILLDANTTVTINSVTFSAMNFGISGTLNLHTGAWSNVAYNTKNYVLEPGKDGKEGNLTNNVIAGGDKSTESAALSAANGNIMFIPVAQTTEDSSATTTITINYTVSTTDTKLDGEKSEITNNITVTVPNTFSFEAGKAYNFVLKIGLTSVKLAAIEVADWGTGTISGWDSITF